MIRFILSILVIIIFIFPQKIYGAIEIKYKIDEEIITNIDILNEKKYLIFLRPNLKSISHKELSQIAKNSLIREIVKKKELNKIFKNQNSNMFIDELKRSLFKFKNVKNEEELKNLLVNYDIDYNKIIEKVKYESMWNELIFKKYNALVKIDEDNLKDQLKLKLKRNKKYEYNLSELLFEIEKNENLEKKYKIIKEYIKLNNFKIATSRYSISNSASRGGEIGWVKETILSSDLNNILKKMRINEISKPIKFPNGYLILKINDKQQMKQKIDFDKELKDLIEYEKNKQLNQFSLLYYKKLKQNIVINEY